MKSTNPRLLLILVWLLIFSCEPDTEILPEIAQDGKISYPLETNIKELADVPEVKSFLENKLGKQNGASWQTNKGGNGTLVQTPFGQIPLEHILEVLDTTGRTNYTFRVLPNTYFENRFYNLIVHKNENKGKMSAFVLEYEMTDAYAAAYRQGNADFSTFSGSIRRYTLDGFLQSGKSAKTNKTMFCSEEDTNPTEDTEECEEIPLVEGISTWENNDPDDGNTGSPGGNGSPTNGDPSNSGSPGSGGGTGSGGGGGGVICAPGGLYLTGCGGTNSSAMHKASACGGPNKAGATYYMGLVCSDGSEIAPTNKSAGNVGEDCDTGDGTVAISPVPFYNLHTALSLTAQQSLCLNDKCDVKNDINSYLRRNINTDGQYNADALSFASAVAKTLVENSCNDDFEVDWDDRITNQLTGKALCINDKLLAATASPSQQSITHNFLVSFSPDSFNEKIITFDQKDVLVNPINGYDLSSATKGLTYTRSNNYYNIDFLNSFIREASDVEIALVMLHEMLHATLLVHERNEGYKSFKDIFKEYSKEKYGSELHHVLMSEIYIIPMAKALSQFDNNQESMEIYKLIANMGISKEFRNPSITNEKMRNAKLKLRDRGDSKCN